MNLSNIVLFLTATLRSIKSSRPIRLFLSNITGGNTRLVIELISSFCGSPNVESERIVKIEGETGSYQVPLHEFTKHALLGEYAHYNPLSSLVACNVFDISYADRREHYLCLLLIAYIASPSGIKDNDGFVYGENVIQEGRRLGFDEEQTRQALIRLASKRLIETPHGHYRELKVLDGARPDSFHYRATSIGIYHIRHWIGDFSFLDATCIDTPIFDQGIRGVVTRAAASHEIGDRYERAHAFRNYLERGWHEANFDANYYDLPQVIASQNHTFQSVEKFLQNGPRNTANGRRVNDHHRGRNRSSH